MRHLLLQLLRHLKETVKKVKAAPFFFPIAASSFCLFALNPNFFIFIAPLTLRTATLSPMLASDDFNTSEAASSKIVSALCRLGTSLEVEYAMSCRVQALSRRFISVSPLDSRFGNFVLGPQY